MARPFVIALILLETWQCASSSSDYHPYLEKEVCESLECRATAKQILEAMDTTADPCNNFYQYSCGGWMKRNNLPIGQPYHSRFHEALARMETRIRDLLVKKDSDNDEVLQKAKLFYKSCMVDGKNESKTFEPVFDFINDLLGLSLLQNQSCGACYGKAMDFSVASYLGKIKDMKDTSPIIKFQIQQDDFNSSVLTVVLDQPDLIMPSPKYYLSSQYGETRQAYVDFLRTFYEVLIKNQIQISERFQTNKLEKLYHSVDQILEFESSLAKIFVPEEKRVDISDKYRKISLREISVIFADFDWLEYLNTITRRVGIRFHAGMTIVLYATDYFRQLPNILRRYHPDVIRNYVVTVSLLKRMRALPKILRDAETVFRRALDGTKAEHARWITCVRATRKAFPLSMTTLYEDRYLSESTLRTVDYMIQQILSSFHNILKTNPWMDSETKNAALKKAMSITSVIGFEDLIFDKKSESKFFDGIVIHEYQFLENEVAIQKFQFNSQLNSLRNGDSNQEIRTSTMVRSGVGAYYSPNVNGLLLTSGILQPPFFDSTRQVSMNYGAIGSIIGHETTHGFNISGSKYDESGNLYNWWTSSSKRRFQKAVNCMEKQYSSYNDEITGMLVNGKLTLAENIADNGGIRIAYDAFQYQRKSFPSSEFSLPGLESFSQEQLFFLSFAQTWCSAVTNNFARQKLIKDKHAPYHVRVHGSLKNFKEFGKAFGCRKKIDSLFPAKNETCIVW